MTAVIRFVRIQKLDGLKSDSNSSFMSMQEAAALASKGAPRAEGFELDLQNAIGVWLNLSTLMLSLESGQNVLVILEVSGGGVRKLKLEKAVDTARASYLCRVGSSWVFLGSWLEDSLLLHAKAAEKSKVLSYSFSAFCSSPLLHSLVSTCGRVSVPKKIFRLQQNKLLYQLLVWEMPILFLK